MELLQNLRQFEEQWRPSPEDKVKLHLEPVMNHVLEKIQNHDFETDRQCTIKISGVSFQYADNYDDTTIQKDKFIEYLKEGLGSVFDVNSEESFETSQGFENFKATICERYFIINLTLKEA